MYLTDGPATVPAENRIGPLSFLAGTGYAVFLADESNKPGHVGFRLSSAGGTIRLFDAQMKEVDNVVYGVQTADSVPGTRARWGEHDHLLTRAHAGHGQYPHAKGRHDQSHLGGTSGG